MMTSFRKNRKGIGLMICSAVFVSFGQMFWKMFHTEGVWALALGLALYAIGALIMIYAYRFGKLSVLQPMLSLSYALAIFIAVFILGETMTLLRLAGILVIVCGVILIGGGDADDEEGRQKRSGGEA
jgi:undecaprenyl phosphate-alpha-L-ara4N flippase subunit ArnE